MRVYHFLNEKFALKNLKNRRLKIATIMELNDPFEFFSLEMSDKELRRCFNQAKVKYSKIIGLLCFSTTWSNPVQWSHYADGHKGVCLGFDVPDNVLKDVTYTNKRLLLFSNKKDFYKKISEEHIKIYLSTKYSHWKYEKETRVHVPLSDKDNDGRYYSDFGHQLKLRQVLIGACSEISRYTLSEALGDLSTSVETFKTRRAFKSFRIIKNRKKALWK